MEASGKRLFQEMFTIPLSSLSLMFWSPCLLLDQLYLGPLKLKSIKSCCSMYRCRPFGVEEFETGLPPIFSY